MTIFDYTSFKQVPVKDVVLRDLVFDEEILP